MTLEPDELPVYPQGQLQPPAQRVTLREAYKTVFRWFCRRVPDEHTAHDLTQTTFLRFRVWQDGHPDLMPDNLEAFLLQQAEWVRRDHYAKAAKIGAAETLSGDPVDLVALEDARLLASVSARSSASAIPANVDLGRAVASLSDTKRLALVLRFVDDLPAAQIATVLDVTPRRVNQLINEAFRELAHSEPLAGYGTPKGGHQ